MLPGTVRSVNYSEGSAATVPDGSAATALRYRFSQTTDDIRAPSTLTPLAERTSRGFFHPVVVHYGHCDADGHQSSSEDGSRRSSKSFEVLGVEVNRPEHSQEIHHPASVAPSSPHSSGDQSEGHITMDSFGISRVNRLRRAAERVRERLDVGALGL